MNLPLLVGGGLAVVLAAGLFIVFRPKPAPPARPPDTNTTAAKADPGKVEPLFTGSEGTGSPDPAAAGFGSTPPTGNPPESEPAGSPPASGASAARIARIRRDVAEALRRKDLEEALRGVTELLRLAPGDPEALQQKALIGEWQSKEARVNRLRQSIPAALAAKNISKGEAEITELLSLVPGDAQALRWREDLIAARDAASTRPDPPKSEPARSEPARSEPARSEPRTVDAAAQERDRIQTVIGGYERALENLSADQYAKLWEGFSGDEKKRLAQSFGDLKAMTVDLKVGSIDVTGETAAASIHESRTLSFKAGKDQSVQRDIVLRFRKSGDQWVIVKLEVR